MLKVTRGRWPRNILIPHATGEDMFTSRMAHELKIFFLMGGILLLLYRQ
jgi:hypothetical protein